MYAMYLCILMFLNAAAVGAGGVWSQETWETGQARCYPQTTCPIATTGETMLTAETFG